MRKSLRPVGILWPLALLTPFLPGLPRATNGGPAWRQEILLALLLTATFALLRLRARKSEAFRAQRTKPSGNAAFLLNGFELSLIVPLAAFVLWSAASTLWAFDISRALHYSTSWTAYLLFFLVMWRAAQSARLLRSSMTVLAIAVAIISAANIIGFYGTPNSLLRQGGLGEPVAVSIPLFAALALTLRRSRAARLCGVAATLGWLSMLEIAERAPFFGVLLGLGMLAAFMLALPRFRPRSLRRTSALAAAFAICLALQAVPSPFAESLHENVFARVQKTSSQEVNTRARILYWQAALVMWRARPLTGVGAGGYDAAFAPARAAFVAAHADSPLVGLNERYMSTGAHNEYLQILGELGAMGLAMFMAFAAALAWAAWRALRRSSSPLVPGAIGSLAVFAISSGASSISFRWFGSGLMFFFAAALVARFAVGARPGASTAIEISPRTISLSPALARRFVTLGTAASLIVFAAMCALASSALLLASAQATADRERADMLYRSALRVNPLDAATHFNYGRWLVGQKRERDAVQHLRYSVARGFNTSTCFAYLAGAESNADELEAAVRTLEQGARVYPRSVFMRARHAASLRRAGREREAELEMNAALLIDSRAARGWQQLIENDIDAAIVAARRDPSVVAMPGELQPDDAVLAVLQENEKRFPEAAKSGWRAQKIRSIELH